MDFGIGNHNNLKQLKFSKTARRFAVKLITLFYISQHSKIDKNNYHHNHFLGMFVYKFILTQRISTEGVVGIPGTLSDHNIDPEAALLLVVAAEDLPVAVDCIAVEGIHRPEDPEEGNPAAVVRTVSIAPIAAAHSPQKHPAREARTFGSSGVEHMAQRFQQLVKLEVG
jgi:hypothetical protein